MKTDEIRRTYLRFFEEKGHSVLPSDSLVPEDDPTLLFTGAGMNQFKDMFLGKGTLDVKKATTCQKCIRTGDIDNVGKTPTHHTFFEMMGNFSFGDYFKLEAIEMAWEFMLNEMKLPEERLSVSIFQDDEESYEIWLKKIGIPKNKIYRFGKRRITGRQVLLQKVQMGLAARAQKSFTIEEKTLDAKEQSVLLIVIANALLRFGIWFLRSLTEETEGYLTPCQIRM